MKIQRRYREKGFTLIESLIVVGLTALIAVGIVAALLEGLDTLHTVTDTQSVEFGHQKAMNMFIQDIHAATWFYNGTVHDEGGAEVLRETPSPFYLVMGYPGPENDEIWVRYKVRPGIFTGENYLMRTVLTKSGVDEGTNLVTTGVANLEFEYLDSDGRITENLPDVHSITMILSINIGGSTTQREYQVVMRNPNMGVREPTGDFDDIETKHINK